MSTQVKEKIITKGLVTYIDGAYANSIVSGSLVWKDLMRTNTDTSLINGASYNTSQYIGGVPFDGTDDYVSIPYNYALTTEPFAVEIWRKHVSTSVYLPGILSCGNYLGSGAYGSPGWCIGYYNSNGTRITAAIADSAGLNKYVSHLNVSSYSPFNSPQHIFFHRNTNNQEMSLFVNGNKQSVFFSNDITIGGGNRTSLQAYTWGSGGPLMFGALYAVKLYYNVNFTDSEILQCFNSTRERFSI
jgi:hypothetical protein